MQPRQNGKYIPRRRLTLNRMARPIRVNRSGAAVVEFAVVAPVFILLVFGMIEFGRMVMVQQVLTNASREGARLAVLDGVTVSDVEASVETFLAASAVSGATIAVDPDPLSDANLGDPVTVTVSVPFGSVSWLPVPMYIGGQTLTATSVMRRESTS